MLRFLFLVVAVLVLLNLAFHLLVFFLPIVVFVIVCYAAWRIVGPIIKRIYDSLD